MSHRTAMNSRFNSFYQEDFHPFVTRFSEMFNEAQKRSNRPWWLTSLLGFWGANRRFDENNAFVRQFCADVLAHRRKQASNSNSESCSEKKREDVFSAMLNRKDPVTGKLLSDDMIIDNMITALFAGHDTTEALISFFLAHLVMNPRCYRRVQDEVDAVVGKKGELRREHLDRLSYTRACMREALRLESPAQVLALTPTSDSGAPVVIGKGRYAIYPGQSALILVPDLHRDPEVWGDDAEQFRPERMLDDEFDKLPRNSYKPFGHGVRGCIGKLSPFL